MNSNTQESVWETLYRNTLSDLETAHAIIGRMTVENHTLWARITDMEEQDTNIGNAAEEDLLEEYADLSFADRLSVDLFGNMGEEEDPLEEIGRAQDRYYASLDGMLTPPSTPTSERTSPPKLERTHRIYPRT